MENQTNNSDFSELRSLLQEQATMVPACDLEEGFLNDLHSKLRSESMKRSSLSLFWERLNMQVENFMSPSLAYGGAAFAALALALGLGFLMINNDASAPNGGVVTTVSENAGNIKQVSNKSIDYDGAVPAFYDESNDF